MGDFEADTRVEGEPGGRYRAVLSRDWEIWGPNGGYVATIALRAAGREARIQRPASFAAHFLGVARFEPVDVEVRALHQGRRSESFHVSVRQAGRPILEKAGYADVTIEPVESELSIGGAGLDATVEFLLGIGPAAAALRDASREQRALVATAIRDAIAPYATSEGVRMRGAAWIVHARRGA